MTISYATMAFKYLFEVLLLNANASWILEENYLQCAVETKIIFTFEINNSTSLKLERVRNNGLNLTPSLLFIN